MLHGYREVSRANQVRGGRPPISGSPSPLAPARSYLRKASHSECPGSHFRRVSSCTPARPGPQRTSLIRLRLSSRPAADRFSPQANPSVPNTHFQVQTFCPPELDPLSSLFVPERLKNHRALLVVATPTTRTLGGLFDVSASADRQQRVWELHLGHKHAWAVKLETPHDPRSNCE
jgi:hypothetical protein